jgi:acyl carrier protein
VTRDEAAALVTGILVQIAPDLAGEDLDTAADLQEEYDLDSMDVLNLVAGVGAAVGTEIPDRDAAGLRSVDDFAGWCMSH